MPVTKKITELAQVSAAAGDDVPIAQGGFLKRAKAGQAGGFALLDSAGKLAHRALYDYRYVSGSSSELSTTAVVLSNPMSDLATDDIQIPTGAIVFVSVDMVLRNDSSSGLVVAAVGYSSDAGSTWTNPGHLTALAESAAVGKRVALAFRAAITGLGGTNTRFRAYFGNAAGNSHTIACHANYRRLLVEVWR